MSDYYKKIVAMPKAKIMSLFIYYYFIMTIVIRRINKIKLKFMLCILPALYDVLNAVALQYG